MNIHSGTGPDDLPARILKMCAKQMALPIALLTFRIIGTGHWPEIWLTHWIVPIYKRDKVFRSKNYRGVHLTAQMSKVIERLVKTLLDPYLERTIAYGENKFAYRKQRGARDALALLVIEWILTLNSRGKVAVYCSDVAGAFDRVKATR